MNEAFLRGGLSNRTEGYVYVSYGDAAYLSHVLASICTLRRYDTTRPVALYCSEEHRETLLHYGLDQHFQRIKILPPANRSIVGFKHNLFRFMPFDRNLYLDSDMVWCRDAEPLWQQFSAFPYTITGHERADFFFGGPKGAAVIIDFMLDRRGRTLRQFGLSHLPRVQSGMIFAQDKAVTERVCTKASEFLARRAETHFRSRLSEGGRELETCEWSLAMAMSHHQLHVFPWFQGYNSPQLDFIEGLTVYDPEFRNVSCRYYADRFVNSLRGLANEGIRSFLTNVFRRIPGKGDYMNVTPFTLHFGWMHQKQPFYDYAEVVWKRLTRDIRIPTEHA